MTHPTTAAAPPGSERPAPPGLLDRLRDRWRLGRKDWRDLTLWALDLETGGLQPKNDSILSIGMVPIRNGAIRLGESYHTLVQPRARPGTDSLKVHHILSGDLADAPSPAEALPPVSERLRDAVLLVHQASVDVPFLRHAFRPLGLPDPPHIVVDTVRLLFLYARKHGLLNAERETFPTGLAAARARFGLPRHREHEALSDAAATAELFLILAARLEATKLRHLL